MKPPKQYPLVLSVLPDMLQQSIPVHPHTCFAGPHTVYALWAKELGFPRAELGFPRAELTSDGCSHAPIPLKVSIALVLCLQPHSPGQHHCRDNLEKQFPSAWSCAAMPASFWQAGGQVLLPGPAGSFPLAFRLLEYCLGQLRGGAGGAAGATWLLSWQSRLSCLGCAVQPPSLLHPQLRARWAPISAHSMPLPHVLA